MPRVPALILIHDAGLLFACVVCAQTPDIAGSKDHALISRHPGSHITFYAMKGKNDMPLVDQVLRELKKLTERLEGGSGIDYMFKDAYNRVASGYGIDLDRNAPGFSNNSDMAAQKEGIPKAQGFLAKPPVLPYIKWKRLAGSLVTDALEIERAWRKIKYSPQQPADPKKQFTASWYQNQANLRLDPESMRVLFERLAHSNYEAVKKYYFKDFDRWPLDAQLAIMSMSWSGPGLFKTFGTFSTLCNSEDFGLATNQCAIAGPGTVMERNRINKLLLQNAQVVVSEEKLGYYSKKTLYWFMVLL